jgi:uncharacterized membrane protein
VAARRARGIGEPQPFEPQLFEPRPFEPRPFEPQPLELQPVRGAWPGATDHAGRDTRGPPAAPSEPHLEVCMAAHGTTSPTSSGAAGGSTPVLVDLTLRLEHAEGLDRLVEGISHSAATLVQNPKVADVLHGRFMGHALHPLLTDVPIGTWTSAFVLDLVGGRKSRPAATRLVGTGILAALPTAVTGLAEFAATSDQAARRVGVVHALGNNVALGLYVLSYRARRRGHHLRGTGLGMVALGLVGATGFLGAHLSLARKVATRDPAFAAQVPLPGEAAAGTSPLADAAGLTAGARAADDAGTGRHVDTGTDPTAQI